MFLNKMIKAVTCKIALKAVRKNSENMSSQMYKQDFSSIQNIWKTLAKNTQQMGGRTCGDNIQSLGMTPWLMDRATTHLQNFN